MTKISQEEWNRVLATFLDYEIRGSSKLSPVWLFPMSWVMGWYLHKAKVKAKRWAESVAGNK